MSWMSQILKFSPLLFSWVKFHYFQFSIKLTFILAEQLLGMQYFLSNARYVFRSFRFTLSKYDE